MEKLKSYLFDFAKAAAYGMGAALCLGLLFFLAGLAAKRGGLTAALNITRSGLFLVGGLCLLITAGMILMKKDITQGNFLKQWRRQFQCMKDTGVIATVSGCVLLLAMLVDYLLFYGF